MKQKAYKVAAVQAAPVYLNLEKSIGKAVSLIEEAASKGAALIGFPETWLPGYPLWPWLDSPAWGMQFVQRYFENSLILGSEEAGRINQAAAKNNIFVVMGYSERSGGSLYLGQSLISNRGETIATRRKLKPTHVERTVFGEGDGSHLWVHDTELGRIGALCCWEHFQPLTKYAMSHRTSRFTLPPGHNSPCIAALLTPWGPNSIMRRARYMQRRGSVSCWPHAALFPRR